MYKCFGCGAGGSVINFLMEKEKIDFVEAVETLRRNLASKLSTRGGALIPLFRRIIRKKSFLSFTSA
jgi:DNA primase